MFVEEYKVNGKVIGHYYKHKDKLFLMILKTGAKNKAFLPQHNAWRMETRIIRQAQHKGCYALGITHKVGKEKMVYIAPLSMFLSEPSEPHFENGKEPMRRLKCSHFPINTKLSSLYIAKNMKVKR